jgi:hypothetical protein
MYNFNNYGLSAILVLVMLALLLIPTILYLITLQKALEAVSAENRQMPPGQVWLSLIPLFNFVWMFFVVNKIADSFQLECYRLNIPTTELKSTKGIGSAKNILRICTFIPFLSVFANIGFIICWIIYWVKVNQIKNLSIANRDNLILDAERGIFHQ